MDKNIINYLTSIKGLRVKLIRSVNTFNFFQEANSAGLTHSPYYQAPAPQQKIRL